MRVPVIMLSLEAAGNPVKPKHARDNWNQSQVEVS